MSCLSTITLSPTLQQGYFRQNIYLVRKYSFRCIPCLANRIEASACGSSVPESHQVKAGAYDKKRSMILIPCQCGWSIPVIRPSIPRSVPPVLSPFHPHSDSATCLRMPRCGKNWTRYCWSGTSNRLARHRLSVNNICRS